MSKLVEKKKVIMCGPTHVATKHMRVEGAECITIQRLHNRCLRYGNFEAECLVVDEISQVNTLLWTALVPLGLLGCQIICMGDPENQLLSVLDSWMDVPLSIDVSQGTMLKSLCGNKRLRLTEGKRSGRVHVDFYASLSTIGWRCELPLTEMLAEARQAFANRGFADVNLVISHRQRVMINKRVQDLRVREERPSDVLRLEAIKQTGVNTPQEMRLWKGVLLTAVLDGLTKEGIYNSQLLKVISWDKKNITLQCIEAGREYDLTHGFVQRNCRLAYAMTYASIQGRSCPNSVALWDTQHPKFTRRHLVMALSRSTSSDLVWLGD